MLRGGERAEIHIGIAASQYDEIRERGAKTATLLPAAVRRRDVHNMAASTATHAIITNQERNGLTP